MKSSKLVLTCLILTVIFAVCESGNSMRRPSSPSRSRTGMSRTSHRRGSFGSSSPDRLFRANAFRRRRPSPAPVRPGSPNGRSSSPSRSNSPASPKRNPQAQQQQIPKIIVTPPQDERPGAAGAASKKKVTFSKFLPTRWNSGGSQAQGAPKPNEAPVQQRSPTSSDTS